MTRLRPTLLTCVAACFLLTLHAQTADEMRRLKELVAAQERQISDQDKEIDALRTMMDEQKRLLEKAMGRPSPAPQNPLPM